MLRTYRDVAAEIRRRIESGHYPPDRPLPSERDLGEAFGIHRATLRRALAGLEKEGVVRRSPGDRPYPCPPRRPIVGSIGFCATDRDDPFARSLVANGIVDELRTRGSSLRLIWSDDHAFRPDEPFSPDLGSLAGLVLWPPGFTDVDRLKTLRRSMPTVLVDAPVVGYESDFVGFLDEEAGYEAARHLYEQGHRRIAFVGLEHVITTRYRHQGLRRFQREAGLEAMAGHEPLVYVDRMPTSAVDAYFKRPLGERPTAFLCENDETAANLMPHLTERGLRIPDDIALMGFGGAQPVLLSALGMTTMEQPYIEVGRQAARLLLARLEDSNDGPHQEIRLPMRLRVRASSGGVVKV